MRDYKIESFRVEVNSLNELLSNGKTEMSFESSVQQAVETAKKLSLRKSCPNGVILFRIFPDFPDFLPDVVGSYEDGRGN